jgi:hypothetical protein
LTPGLLYVYTRNMTNSEDFGPDCEMSELANKVSADRIEDVVTKMLTGFVEKKPIDHFIPIERDGEVSAAMVMSPTEIKSLLMWALENYGTWPGIDEITPSLQTGTVGIIGA